MYDPKTLQTTITQLISIQHEGNYWDFKRKWHKNLADLLHDIICLANSSTTGEKYIIIGAGESDIRKTFSVVGVKQNDSNRKDTKDLNDFLSTVSFVGDIRPMVHVRQVAIGDKKLDVIVIEPSTNTPFILAKDYKHHPEKDKPTIVHCGHIYTRIGDKNTPKDKTADNDKVEALWRRRFRLDATPTERLSYYLLRPDEWEIVNSTDDNVIAYYYKYAPEYRIEFEDCNSEARSGDFLCKGWINGPSVYHNVTFKLFETPIQKYKYSYSKSMAYAFIKPYYAIAGTNFSVTISRILAYYIDNTPECNLGHFMRSKFQNSVLDMLEPNADRLKKIIIFNSEEQKRSFIEYAASLSDSILELSTDPFPEINEGTWSQEEYKDWQSTKRMKNLYYRWQHN